ncbi:uncharacterized protein LOC130900705 isoform X1 [Diorhabda carinulata]|uniref:uncharacterized protein LOC130900705 isoform X1 n=2 Tax=Diorhabda carinulata TaxID=1163345 RepID=UPI0025A29114|nr:uncharacterized protein LOC130900705 isoform X1 [Diorhabda carinulata]XP_057667481.1 uncharacterized protein LOC130900705 isoform X1 [Diorhabda carinulata]
MLERTTRSYFEDVITDFKYLQTNIGNKKNKSGKKKIQKNEDYLLEEHIMTRKTRTRRPRISALQSGYCAVCNIPYNSVEDHIQSKKHQKLIGEDANYIALNGSLNGYLQTNTIPFLNLNGIDAIGVHDTSLDEFSPIHRKRNMRKSRTASVMLDRVNPSPLSPTGSDITGHHLRSRRNINYMTPPLEDDSLEENPESTVSEEPSSELENKEKDARELRSTTRSLTKLMLPIPDNHQEEVWNSGRPKRACINKKRLSAEERSNFKTFYKVEVLTSKPRSFFIKNPENTKRQQSQSPKREEDKDKGLIVKFKKLRNSELIQLNNEATNFLFPKKDDTSEEEEEAQEEEDEVKTITSSVDSCSNVDTEENSNSTSKVKNEDEGSMDSMGKKKKRRTHAEAFIMDNQKYYKFETPGSSYCRLRYQGSYLPLVVKTPEVPNNREIVKPEEPVEKKVKYSENDSKIKMDNYKFAFEKVPSNTGWYNAFKRLDNAEQSYAVFSNYLWEAFLLPYQMRSIPPLDPKVCYQHYDELLKSIIATHNQTKSASNSRNSSPEPSITSSSSSLYDPDDDSKLSASTSSSICSTDDKTKGVTSKVRKSNRGIPASSGKNPRKSPRQHASTLAILSDLVQQRKRRSKNKPPPEETVQNLPTIQEEPPPQPPPVEVEEPPPKPPTPVQYHHHRLQTPKQPIGSVKKTTVRKVKPKIDYFAMAKQIEEEFDKALNDDIIDCELEISDDAVDFNNSRTTLQDILGLYEENNSRETEKSCRRFFNGTPGRKPGMKKRKSNRTGWPNKSKRTTKKEPNKEKGENDTASTIGSASINNSEEEDEEEEEKEVVETPVKKAKISDKLCKEIELKSDFSDQNCDAGKNRVKVLSNKLVNSDLPQPYVCVQKLDSKKLVKHYVAKPKRTTKRPRRIPGSPKSPRMLRKPRGKWYRER